MKLTIHGMHDRDLFLRVRMYMRDNHRCNTVSEAMRKFGDIINAKRTNISKSSIGQFVSATYYMTDADYMMFQLRFG